MKFDKNEIDSELVRDIILYKYNNLMEGLLFDIEIKNIRIGSKIDLWNYQISEGDYLSVTFDAIIVDDSGKHDKRHSDSITIEGDEYFCLLRQKRLKEIGI